MASYEAGIIQYNVIMSPELQMKPSDRRFEIISDHNLQ